MVGRSRAQIHRPGTAGGDGLSLGPGDGRLLPVHALGSARGAGGVEHGGAPHRILDVGARKRGDGRLVILEVTDAAAYRQADFTVPRVGDGVHTGAQVRIVDHGPGFAVVDHVTSFLAGQVEVHGREADAGPLGGGQGLDELGSVP